MILDLFYITIAVVFVVDVSGFTGSWKWAVKKILHIPQQMNITLKPFDCSLCCTFWSCVIYAIVTDQLTLTAVMLSCVCAYCAQFVRELFYIIKELFTKLTNKL